jgi:hypothetical protein
MNYNSDLPGGKQVTKGDKKKLQLYSIWIIPLDTYIILQEK